MRNEISEIEALFKALGLEKRMRIIHYLLKNDRKTVSDLSYELHIPVTTISRHLLILRRVGLLDRQHIRNEVYYSVGLGRTTNQRVFLLALIKNAYENEERKSKGGSAFDSILLSPYSELLKYVRG